MKFMKLGSKPDSFQSKGDNVRYVATELATEIVVNIGDIRFYLHKFPLLSKSGLFKKLITTSLTEENQEEIHISEIPGGPAAFEICVKFCYGITVTLNAYNVIAARCAAEFLEMNETIEKSNLIYKIEVFLSSTIFHSWKDSIIVLQTTRTLNSSQELKFKLVKRCLDAIALIASIDTMKVVWSYTYSKKKLEKGINGVRKQEAVPKDWWVEDLCDLHIGLYKQVISTIQSKQKVSSNVIGEALEAYVLRKLPGFSKGSLITDIAKYRYLIDSILELIPDEKGSVSFGFLSKLLKAVSCLECCDESVKERLKKRVCLQLEEAAVGDILVFDVDMVLSLVMEFMKRDLMEDNVGNVMKGMVAKVVDGYLTEKSRDCSFNLQMFVSLAESVSGFPRESHDGLYRAIDMFLKENPEISKSEKKRICRVMDCRKLSGEACAHAVQNERLPMRVIVQVLFFEQIRSNNNNNNNNGSSSTGNTTPELIPVSRSTTTTINTEDDWHQD